MTAADRNAFDAAMTTVEMALKREQGLAEILSGADVHLGFGSLFELYLKGVDVRGPYFPSQEWGI